MFSKEISKYMYFLIENTMTVYNIIIVALSLFFIFLNENTMSRVLQMFSSIIYVISKMTFDFNIIDAASSTKIF